MYQKTTFAILVALCFLGAQASNAVEEGPTFSTGDTWAFGIEIALMEEVDSEIQDLENNITSEIIESDNFTQIRNWTGLGLDSFELNNEAVLGFFYTGEIVDYFENIIHNQTEQSLYSHTVVGTKLTSMLPPAGTHDLKIRAYCDDEDWDDETEECGEDGDDGQFMLMDNNTGEKIVMEEVNTELSGGMHYIAKITQDTWWTQDTHELVKTQITVALGASADLTLRNVPNLTYEGESILTAISGPQFECDDGQTIAFEDANNGWEDCEDGSDEPRDDDGDGSTDQEFECDNGDTYPLDYVNDVEWHCENGEDEGEGGASPCSDWEENEEEKEAICYETINVLYETAVVSMDAEVSINLQKGQFLIFNPDHTGHQTQNLTNIPRNAFMLVVKRNAWLDALTKNETMTFINVDELAEQKKAV